jgi:hypothetical protein
MAPPRRDTVQVTFRIENAMKKRAEALAVLLSRPGLPVSFTDTMRAALLEGFDALEKKYGRKPAK